LHGVASFEEIPPDDEQVARRRREILALKLPYLVAERSGRVVGYCYASRYRTRSAYRFTLEDSIYVDAGEVGRGVGLALLSKLVKRCSELGYRQMVAVVGGSDQWPSIRLHERLGFTRVGLLPAVGFKFGNWIDCVLMSGRSPPARRPHPARSVEECSRAETTQVVPARSVICGRGRAE
jgi:L-amino acid N-acyltransferase YncA